MQHLAAPSPSTDTNGQNVLERVLKNSFSNAVDFVFPPICIVCEQIIAPQSRWLCLTCIADLHQNHPRRKSCSRCGQNRNLHSCTCLSTPWTQPFESISSLFDFTDQIQSLVHQIKYNGRSSLALELGRIAVSLLPADFFSGIDALVPVPLHFLRRWSRGYNQSAILCRGIIESLPQPLPILEDVLIRSRYTKTQTAINRQGRFKNVASAFASPPGKEILIKGKSILLVDDVVTTGATTAACATALIKSGCKTIKVLSLARD